MTTERSEFERALEDVGRAKTTDAIARACENFTAARAGRGVTCEEANGLLRAMPFQTRRLEAMRALGTELRDFENECESLGRGLRSWEAREIEDAVREQRKGETSNAIAREETRERGTGRANGDDDEERRDVMDAPSVEESMTSKERMKEEEMTAEKMKEAVRRATNEPCDQPCNGGQLFVQSLDLLDQFAMPKETINGPVGRQKFAVGGPKAPASLAAYGVSDRDWSQCVELMWKAQSKSPCFKTPVLEFLACCCPFGPLTYLLNHFNPICWCMYCPMILYKTEMCREINKILAPSGVFALVTAKGWLEFYPLSAKITPDRAARFKS